MGSSHKEWKRLGDGSLPTEDQDVGLGHIVSIRTYSSVFFSLILLTGVTVWAATQEFGALNLPVALLIAATKAGIVTLFFMHLNFEGKIIWGIVIYPLFIFVLILAGTLGDRSVKRTMTPAYNMIEVVAPTPTSTTDGAGPKAGAH